MRFRDGQAASMRAVCDWLQLHEISPGKGQVVRLWEMLQGLTHAVFHATYGHPSHGPAHTEEKDRAH
eukprot:2919385-Amphidinium_carterae.1